MIVKKQIIYLKLTGDFGLTSLRISATSPSWMTRSRNSGLSPLILLNIITADNATFGFSEQSWVTRGSNFPSSTNPVSCVEVQVVRIASRMQTQNDNHNGSGLQRSMVIDIHKHKYFIINTKCVVLCTFLFCSC